MISRRKLAIGAAVLAGCSFAGGAYAATKDSGPKQAFLSDVAARLNVTPERLSAALQGAFLDQLNAAVKAGKLSQAQANAIERRIRERGDVPFGIFGPGHLGILGPERFGFRHIAGGGPLRSAASYIGISEMQLLGQLAGGKSLGQIAKAHGKSESGLESALIAAMRSNLDRLRSGGLITSAQEQRALSRMQEQVGWMVTHSGTWFGPPPRALRQFAPPPGLPAPPGEVLPLPGQLPPGPPA
jgi:hypothetical protein